jgi:hypothetical protein
MRGIVNHLAWKDPSRAIEFARQLADPTVRVTAFEQIAPGLVIIQTAPPFAAEFAFSPVETAHLTAHVR